MRRVTRAAVLLAVLTPFLLGAAAGAGDAQRTTAFRFTDPEIVESSALVVLPAPGGPLVVTTNDSGDAGRVFVVDPASGDTVGVTSFSPEPRDVEALTPAGVGGVWVADIGDNLRERETVELRRVPVGRGDRVVSPPRYELAYPDGPRDAEALVADPLTGRLFLITKGIFSGTVYAVPARLRSDRPNLLVEVGTAPGLVTDAAFLPGGGGVVLRSYTSGYILDARSWQDVASWTLPSQEQGEGIAVVGDEVLLSTEGVRSRVLRSPLPPEAVRLERAAPTWTALRCVALAYGIPLPG